MKKLPPMKEGLESIEMTLKNQAEHDEDMETPELGEVRVKEPL